MGLEQFQFDGANWTDPDTKDRRYYECLYEALKSRYAEAVGSLGGFNIPSISENLSMAIKNILSSFDSDLRSIIPWYYNHDAYVQNWNYGKPTEIWEYKLDKDGVSVKYDEFDTWHPVVGNVFNLTQEPDKYIYVPCIHQIGTGFQLSLRSNAPDRWTITTISEACGFSGIEWAYPTSNFEFSNEYLKQWIITRYKLLNKLRYYKFSYSTYVVQVDKTNIDYGHRWCNLRASEDYGAWNGGIAVTGTPFDVDNGNIEDYQFGYDFNSASSTVIGYDALQVKHANYEQQTGNCITWGAWSDWGRDINGGYTDCYFETYDSSNAVFADYLTWTHTGGGEQDDYETYTTGDGMFFGGIVTRTRTCNDGTPPDCLEWSAWSEWSYSYFTFDCTVISAMDIASWSLEFWNVEGSPLMGFERRTIGSYGQGTYGYIMRERECTEEEMIPAETEVWDSAISVLATGTGQPPQSFPYIAEWVTQPAVTAHVFLYKLSGQILDISYYAYFWADSHCGKINNDYTMNILTNGVLTEQTANVLISSDPSFSSYAMSENAPISEVWTSGVTVRKNIGWDAVPTMINYDPDTPFGAWSWFPHILPDGIGLSYSQTYGIAIEIIRPEIPPILTEVQYFNDSFEL